MAKRGDPGVLRLLVIWLRSVPKWTQAKFAQACGIRQCDISHYENGIEAPSEEVLRRMASAVKMPWAVVVQVRRLFEAALAVSGQAGTGPADETAVLWGEVLALATTPYLLCEEIRDGESKSLELLRREAEDIWRALAPMPPGRGLFLLKAYPGGGLQWEALIERICRESAKAGADDPREALALAEFALEAAKLATWEEGRRLAIAGYIWGFIGNAQRVANELDLSACGFAESRRLIESGERPELLDLDRLLDLEASLRRDRQEFEGALALLEEARESASGPSAVGRILLKKEHVFERKGDYRLALKVLAEAEPYIRQSGDTRLLFAYHFNTADNLYHLERYEEGAAHLGPVRELALQERNALDLLRVRWLEARYLGVQGREEDAISAFEEVQEAFARERLPYDAALSALDLSLLLLKRGEAETVKTLALEMTWIFAAQSIHREALVAIGLFVEAAKLKRLSVDLVSYVIEEVERHR